MRFFERQFNRLPWWIRWPSILVFGVVWIAVAILLRAIRWFGRRRTGIQPVQQLEAPREARKRCTSTIKRRVLKRDNHICRECGHGVHDGRKVVVDHWLSVVDFPEFAAAIWNLRCLCWECNEARSDEIPAMVIDWDCRPPRELCATAVIVAVRQVDGPREDIQEILVRAA